VGKSKIQYLDLVELRAYGGPGEQVNLNPWICGLNVLDRGEQVRWRAIDIEAGKAVICG